MSEHKSSDPLHGLTLMQILIKLVEYYGWEELGLLIEIRCFNSNPSINSCLKFLRKTPWARKKVENLYLDTDFDKPLGEY
ncbi:MAG: VF530 family protein [Bacteroidetes bacterium]|nr:VF530 family protein [Bacteroidota bacterium]MBU1114507.1 VF530 family protein [Bacteroidota bacterium]MBU1799691.1 VF530 family protein [Bacteroidota bacterium]